MEAERTLKRTLALYRKESDTEELAGHLCRLLGDVSEQLQQYNQVCCVCTSLPLC